MPARLPRVSSGRLRRRAQLDVLDVERDRLGVAQHEVVAVDAVEALENVRQVLGGDPRAVVDDADLRLFAVVVYRMVYPLSAIAGDKLAGARKAHWLLRDTTGDLHHDAV